MQRLPLIFILLLNCTITYASQLTDYCAEGEKYINEHRIDYALGLWRRSGDPDSLVIQGGRVFSCIKQTRLASSQEETVGLLKTYAMKYKSKNAIILLATYYFTILVQDTYATGNGDIDSVLYWVNAGIKENMPDSQFLLATMYLNGYGVEKSIHSGMQKIEEAAVNGSIPAQTTLAFIYEHGSYGLEKNQELAQNWSLKADETAALGGWGRIGKGYEDQGVNMDIENELFEAACLPDSGISNEARDKYCK